MGQICALERIAPNCNRRIITGTPLAGGWYPAVAALMILICLASPAPAQLGDISEYFSTDTPRVIPDYDTDISELTVSDTGEIIDLNVMVHITHEYDGNLDIFLIAPDGTRVELFTDVGKNNPNFDNTILDDEAAQSITDGSAPFSGSYRPEGSLADFVGKDINGLWALEVTDDWRNEGGTLESWCLIATLQPKEPLPAPAIESKSDVPGGMRNGVSWDDVCETTQYRSTFSEDIPLEGTLTKTLAVDDLCMIEDLNVRVNISHEWDSELDVYLVAPDGTRIRLFTDVGDSGDDFIDTILDDQASKSITQGTAPFTGRYRPEGSLDNLTGKDINGEWTLEITDDSWHAGGTLNSWSLIADLANILYYVECGADAGFGTVVADSGWTTNQSHTFAGLDPKNEYWYRAKARPLKSWSQTSLADFEADVLTDTEATDVGDVQLPSGGGGLGPEIHVIEDPSFESGADWWAGSNNAILLFLGMDIYPDYIWGTDGRCVAGVIFTDDFFWDRGDLADWHQPVDWTGVETLVLDYCSTFGNQLVSKVLIGDTEIWADRDTGEIMDVHEDVTIDVSDFTGTDELKLRVEVDRGGSFIAGIFWDNLRTYGPGSTPAGSVISTPIDIGADDTWHLLAFDATIPPGTELTVDVLRETGSTPISGYRDVLSGTDLSGISARTIRLRANLSTSDPAVTPALHCWSVTYGKASRESDWSNVESSLP
jgi:subtilisin-like proprotein convertase family protein